MQLNENYTNTFGISPTLSSIIEEFQKLKGQFVITDSWKIERLVGIGDDGSDYYYITYNGRKLTWNTCVGKLVKLKGKIDDADYNEFIRLAKLNHYDQFIDIRETVIKELETLNGTDQIAIGLYMELE